MTAPTPLEALDAAVTAFAAAIKDAGVVSGWVLAYQTSAMQTATKGYSPLVWAPGYAVSAGLSPFAAIGLADHVAHVIRAAYEEPDS